MPVRNDNRFNIIMRNNRSYKSVRFVGEDEIAADLRPWTTRLMSFIAKSLHGIQELHGKLMHIIGPEQQSTRPHRYTVVWSFIAFILFAVLTCVAVKVTTAAMRISYACVSCGLFVVLTELIVADLAFDSELVPRPAIPLMGHSLLQGHEATKEISATLVSPRCSPFQ